MTPAELHNYIFTELVCGCGDPVLALTYLRDVMQLIHDRSESSRTERESRPPGVGWPSSDAWGRYSNALDAKLGLTEKPELFWWFWYVLDNLDLIEHGSNITGSWLTDKGQELLAALKASDIEKLVESEHVDDPPARHLMAVPVTVELLTEMIREGYRGGAECTQGIPADGVLVSSSIKTEPNGSQVAHLVFEHESFPLVEPGAEIPTKQIIFFGVQFDQKPIQENLIQVGGVSCPAPDMLPSILVIEVFLGRHRTFPGRIPLTTAQARDLAAILQNKADEVDGISKQ